MIQRWGRVGQGAIREQSDAELLGFIAGSRHNATLLRTSHGEWTP
jgi:hypothetical protein